ncbi:MAG: 16S rRNA (cytosine(967)-C(5))-methyltransferase RsmB [Clostridia bacterium]
MKTTREISTDILHSVLEDGGYANLILNRSLSGMEDRRDRAFVTNLVYGTLHRLTPIDYQLTSFLQKPVRSKDAYLKTILRAAFYEILYTSVKSHAVVNEYVNLGKKKGNPGWGKMINGILRNLLRKKEELIWPSFADEAEKTAFFASVPFWLVDFWKKERDGETAEKLIRSIDEERYPVLRVNTLKTDRNSLKEKLNQCGIETLEGNLSVDALRTKKGADLRKVPAELRSCFTVQEESSQLVAKVLGPQSGETVLDMCAAPGGKTTHLAQEMKNSGVIYASDLHAHKIDLIRENASRLGIDIIRAEQKDGTLWGEEYPCFFDAILLDAPCSGLGVLNRRSDSRLRKNGEDISALADVQRKLLISAYKALKPGGRLVYSTCTLSHEENRNQAEWLLKTFPDMKPQSFDGKLSGLTEEEKKEASWGTVELLPYIHETDGFFISCFKKDV